MATAPIQVKPPPVPADTEAEQIVLGSCLLSADALTQVEPLLTPPQFYMARHEWIYGAMLALSRRGQPIEPVLLARELERAGQLDEAGGLAYLTELTLTATPIHAPHYARIVARHAFRRRLIAAANQIARLAYDTAQADDDTELQARAIEALNTAMPELDDDAVLFWDESLGRFLATQAERQANQDAPRFDLPWPGLSWVTPLQPGMLAIVAAEDGIGKTAFAEVLAEYWARVKGFRVAFFHFELSHTVMLDRRQVRRTRAPIYAIQQGMLDDAMHAAVDEMYHWPGQIHYVHCPGWSMARVASIARQLIRAGKAQVVVVDYLGKANIEDYRGEMNTAQRRGADVETLKNLAEREGVPILLLSQLSREATHQAHKTRHTIRDTGDASNRSNLVLLLDRDLLDKPLDFSEAGFGPLVYDEGEYSPVVKVRVDKHTLGRTGQAELFMLPTFDIVELDKAQVAAATSWNGREKSWRG